MPWMCDWCNQQIGDGAGQNAPAPPCYATSKCKEKAKSGFSKAHWVLPAQAPVQQTTAQIAAALGYGNLTDTSNDVFNPRNRSNKSLYVNNAGDRGISPDGSTHSGNRDGWKGFSKLNKKWTYQGSYQMDLSFWEHRVNDATTPFPRG